MAALKQCGYPEWSFAKVKKQMAKPKSKPKTKPTTDSDKSRGYVTLPYIQGVTEPVQRILRSHKISSTVKPHTSLRSILVHPKDKLPPEDKTGVVYEIPCSNCKKTYIGETGRRFGTRRKEYQTETQKMTGQKFTRATRKASQSTELKSAIAEHSLKDNHIINWDSATILARDDNRSTRWIRESIWIRRRAKFDNHKYLMNGDEGAYQLSHLYDDLIQMKSSTTSDDVNKSSSRNTFSRNTSRNTISKSTSRNTFSGSNSRNTGSITNH